MKKNIVRTFIYLFLFSLPLGVFAQSPFGQEPKGLGSVTTQETISTEEGEVGPINTNEPTPVQGSAGQNAPLSSGGVSGSGLMPGYQNAGGIQVPAGNGTNPGNPQSSNYWQYLLSLLGIGGSQGTPVLGSGVFVTSTPGENPLLFNNQYTAPVPVKASSGSTFFSCKFNTSKTTLGMYFSLATCVIFALIPIMVALLVLWFMFGSIQYINDSEHENRNQYKIFLMWGVLILFVALSFVGILRMMSTTLGL